MPDPVRLRHILLIDGDPFTPAALKPFFGEHGFEINVTTTGAAGVSEALVHPPSLILLAVTLSDGPGLSVFTNLRNRTRTAHIPIMFLAEHVEAHYQNEVLSAGADDFILKPFDLDILALRVRNAIQRMERDGLNHPRTGLPTGRLIQERVRALSDEYGWYKIDFAIANFDSFRDRYGFVTGEEVLSFAARLVGDVMQTDATPDDFLGQRSDTEFVIIARRANGPKIREKLEKRFNEEVRAFYSFVEREQGYIEVEDSSGVRVAKPLMIAQIKVQEGEPDDEPAPEKGTHADST